MKQISFTHLRYAGAVADTDSAGFTAELNALKSQVNFLWTDVVRPLSGFTDILIAGEEASGSRLKELLTRFHLHWKEVLIVRTLHRRQDAIDYHAVADYIGELSGIDRIAMGSGIMPTVRNEEVTVLIESTSELAARFAAEFAAIVDGKG